MGDEFVTVLGDEFCDPSNFVMKFCDEFGDKFGDEISDKFGDGFGDEFGDEFGETPNLVMNPSPYLVMTFV